MRLHEHHEDRREISNDESNSTARCGLFPLPLDKIEMNNTDKTIIVPLVSDGVNKGFKVVSNPDYTPPSYTLAQLSALAREYVEAARETWGEQDVMEVELQLSLFLAWIQTRQKKGEQR